MTKRKTKRNGGRSQTRHGFKIGKDPTVHLAGNRLLPPVNGFGVTHSNGQPSLFAIGRDSRTIFVSWNVDWRAVFQKAMPADRQVHLRLIGREGVIETRVAVEPMSGMHHLTTSRSDDSYRVEIGYFQPLDAWHSIAISDEIKMPPQRRADIADVDVATIPFHVGFQQLIDMFGVSTTLANVMCDFQKRLMPAEKLEDLSPHQREILRKLDLSPSELVSARRGFEQIDKEKLARRTRLLAGFSATGASWPSEADSPLAGS